MMSQRANESSPFELPSTEIENLLRAGEDPRLRSYFGDENYEELRELLQEPPLPVRRGGPLVLIVPGILGSTIGIKGRVFNDTIWFDPVSILRGDATKMALTPRQRCEALDIIPGMYLALRLRLRRAGWRVADHYYDWRLGLDGLGRELADRIADESAAEVYLVAHSMGGLVSRAALAVGGDKVKRLVMLGTPNRGSFAAVQVLRGVNSTVRMVGRIDLDHSTEELANRVFSTFSSVYHMLPLPEVFSQIDLYDINSWPADGPRPRKQNLSGAREIQQGLAPADERLRLIAGDGRETVTDMSLDVQGNFVYHTTNRGDETVPTVMAQLPDLDEHTWYVDETHSKLVWNKTVARAVLQLLDTGTTNLLGAEPDSRRAPAPGRSLTDQTLDVADPFHGRRGQALTDGELAFALRSGLSSLPPTIPALLPCVAADATAAVLGDAEVPLTGVVVGRRTRHRLDVELVQGSIFDVPVRSYVLGILQNVTPSGPAACVDEATNGAVSEFVSRKLLSGEVGRVFMMPTGRHPLRSDVVLFAGLGEFDRFQSSYESVLRLVGHNTLRTLLNSGIDELGTVVMGGASGRNVTRSLNALIKGFAEGLRATEGPERFRRIVICETNPQRYSEIKRHLYWRAASAELEDVEITLDEVHYRETAPKAVRGPAVIPTIAQQPSYLYARLNKDTGGRQILQASVLTAGNKATVVPSARELDAQELDELLDQLSPETIDGVNMDDFGTELSRLLFTPEFVDLLARERVGGNHHLAIIHDVLASRIPWETLRFGDKFPCLAGGISRRLEAMPNSIAKWIEERRIGDTMDVLLIVNPTKDLPGAEREGDILAEVLRNLSKVNLKQLRGAEATKSVVLREFTSGDFDVIHYAGHAFFDPHNRGRSGILCHGRERLGGEDLVSMDRLPAMVCFNACESARVRVAAASPSVRTQLEKSVGMAEAFLRGGIAQYVGTYWPVGDAAAEDFARSFYPALVQGESVGQSLLKARKQVRKVSSTDWADYIHYGGASFCLKRVKQEGRR